jgi:hypothetical protein
MAGERKPQETPGVPGILAIAGVGVPGPIAPIQPPPASVPNAGSARGRTGTINVAAYWADKYSYSRCKEANLDHAARIAQGFATAMSSRGHRVAFTRGSNEASPIQFSDKGDSAAFGIDTVEFAILASHGATHGKEGSATDRRRPPWNWVFFWLGTFNIDSIRPEDCRITSVEAILVENPRTHKWHWEPKSTSRPVPTMNLGETRLRWLVLDTCNSLKIGAENVRPVSGYATKHEAAEEKQFFASCDPALTWHRCFDGINMIFGFTGLSSDADWTSTRGFSFGRRAGRGEAMGDAWIDEAYSWACDDAPVALACGVSQDDALKRVNGETLKKPARSLRRWQTGGYKWIWRI